MITEKWWADLDGRTNGVFKGGGAKGLLYAGALHAVAERGMWFRAVAGSSAGAITASLVASGMRPQELEASVLEAMRQMKKMWLGDLCGSPLVRTGGLLQWLEQRLRVPVEASGGVVEDRVTFAQLYEATEIELYVVAVDVARRQPVVFSAFTTPQLAVAPAVIASSAIPIAFWPGRLRVAYGDGTEAVHRLSDGGVWANYPAFVFKDGNFRAYHELAPVPEDSVTIGFTLDRAEQVPPGEPQELLTHRRGAAGDQGVWSLYGLLGRAPVRLYLFALVPLLIAFQAAYTFDKGGLVFLKDWATRPGVPGWITGPAAFLDGFTSGSTLVVILYGAVALMILAALFSAVLGATLLDSGVPTLRTLMAVGTNVPYWVGFAEDDHVVRLPVPAGLDTTSFRLDPARVQAWIVAAHEHAREQLEAMLD